MGVKTTVTAGTSRGEDGAIRLRVRHRDGSWRYFELTAQNLLDDPAVAGIVWNGRDITDRRQAETQLRELLGERTRICLTGGLRREHAPSHAAMAAHLAFFRSAWHDKDAIYVGFKGGSEPGVINLTWLVRSRAGAWHAVTGSWNDPQAPVDEARFAALMQRSLQLVR